jgi:hypothetical protein
MRSVTAKKSVLDCLSQVLDAGNHDELENTAIDIERQLLAKSTRMEKLKQVLDDVQVRLHDGCIWQPRLIECRTVRLQNTHTGVDFSDVVKLIDNFVL